MKPLLKNVLIVSLFASFIFEFCSKKIPESNTVITPPPPPPPPSSNPVRTLINAQLIPAGNLSQTRSDITLASAGNKIFFAGGSMSGIYSSRVDIFDITTNSWSTAELSQARKGIATAVLDKKIYFAGGNNVSDMNSFSSRVDIYNTETNVWSTVEFDNIGALMAGATAGDKVVFASGITAHIYNSSTNSWTTAPLSERPGEGNCCQNVVGGIAATVVDKTIYFAGGLGDWEVHKAIDIYNSASNTWSKSSLSEYKGAAAGISVGNTNYWAGGYTYYGQSYGLSKQVEIRDMKSGSSTFESLFQANGFFTAVNKNDTIVFFTGSGAEKNKFDIYDIKTKTWAIGVLPVNIEGAGIISINNTIYVAGGIINGTYSNKVWKLEF